MATIFTNKERRGNPVTIRMTDRQRELIQTLVEMEFAENQTDLVHRALDLYLTRILSDLTELAGAKTRNPEKLKQIEMRREQLLRIQQMMTLPETEDALIPA